jgi:hypothetical protein
MMATATTTTKRAALAILVAAVLTACGGGGDNVAPSGAGVYKGNADGGREVTTVLLGDGTYYTMYSGTDRSTVGGGVQGTATISGPTFTSSNGLNYNLEGSGTQPATVAATLALGRFLNGTVTSATSGNMAFETDYSGDSDETASLATLAGAYPGNVTFALGVRPAVFTVTPAGAVSTVINECAINGTVSPRTDVNAYNLTIVFSGAPCVFPNASFSGVAYFDTGTGRLSAFVRHAQVPQAIFFVGSRS